MLTFRSNRYRLTIWLLALLVSIWVTPAGAKDLSFPTEAQLQKMRKEKCAQYKVLAEKGDPKGQLQYGLSCFAEDEPEKQQWIKKAAIAGDAGAQYQFGLFLRSQRQQREACDWFEKASDQGHKFAAISLGQCFQYGQGRPQDLAKARQLILKGTGGRNESAELDSLSRTEKQLQYKKYGIISEDPDRFITCLVAVLTLFLIVGFLLKIQSQKAPLSAAILTAVLTYYVRRRWLLPHVDIFPFVLPPLSGMFAYLTVGRLQDSVVRPRFRDTISVLIMLGFVAWLVLTLFLI
jgi:hypothetical protein